MYVKTFDNINYDTKRIVQLSLFIVKLFLNYFGNFLRIHTYFCLIESFCELIS
jgi:hypothetical protein